jgi:L,D-transpeptidase ErfK/SrfK
MWRTVLLCLWCGLAGQAHAAAYDLPLTGDSLVGESYFVLARHKDTLVDIAGYNGVGYDEIKAANPGVDPWLPGEGTRVFIPAEYILPAEKREGMVINLAEKRIYYYPKVRKGEAARVYTYPISIGRQNWESPLGKTRIVRKKKDPTWTPPASIREEHAAKGDILPDVVAAGPNNPLGDRAMYLGIRGYLIHGTNKPAGIGMRVSHGCIRMEPDSIRELFELVPRGTPVTLVDVPFKFGLHRGEIFLEAQRPANSSISMHNDLAQLTELLLNATNGDYGFKIDWNVVDEAIKNPRGTPVPVGLFSGDQAARGMAVDPF